MSEEIPHRGRSFRSVLTGCYGPAYDIGFCHREFPRSTATGYAERSLLYRHHYKQIVGLIELKPSASLLTNGHAEICIRDGQLLAG